MEYDLAIKRNAKLVHSTTWVNCKTMMLGASQLQKNAKSKNKTKHKNARARTHTHTHTHTHTGVIYTIPVIHKSRAEKLIETEDASLLRTGGAGGCA